MSTSTPDNTDPPPTLTFHATEADPPIALKQDAVADYFDPDIISSIFTEYGWSADKELAILFDIAQNGDPKEQLNALRQIRHIGELALTLSGRISKTVLHARTGTPARNDGTGPHITSASSISTRLGGRQPSLLTHDPTIKPRDPNVITNPLTNSVLAADPHNPTPLPASPQTPP